MQFPQFEYAYVSEDISVELKSQTLIHEHV